MLVRTAIAVLLGLVGMLSAVGGTALAEGEPYFARKDTWLETVLAAREALVRQETQAGEQARAARQADHCSCGNCWVLKNMEARRQRLAGAASGEFVAGR
jgi:hypothetical protein